MDGAGDSSLCFPNLNSSCRRLPWPRSELALLYVLLAFVSLLTVSLNLLVIISISHFRQLHTPTNALLLSLAVSDLVVGLTVMPIEGLRYLETCWLLGRLMCALAPFLSYCLISGSLGHMVLISVDRYLAICQPLLYPSRVTLSRVVFLICLCWGCSALYNGCILMGHLRRPHLFRSCHGECVVVISRISGSVDLLFSLVGPCSVMLVLYARVFVAAVSQVSRSPAPIVKGSEWKAARTLGIVIAVFLMCFCPYYYPSFVGEDTTTNLSYFAVLSWIMQLNSCINPLIYALFYPWFRKAVRLIFTLRILQPHSSETKLL
ncbi:Trace amine-associated receptor 7e [Oryzias melastigma]|uniref:Trace amine-associated receptor 7e n=1 Tax=Oryzias melastigma TaxID=30732 RepID=A0A834C5W8_ORYME|nr:trace amine-associated receptor 13c-like [Oryzias melastigma]KAF6725983.1 Trace amine-associated receptor 7e [Oryzias melastigma]